MDPRVLGYSLHECAVWLSKQLESESEKIVSRNDILGIAECCTWTYYKVSIAT